MFEAIVSHETGTKASKRMESKSLLTARTVAHICSLVHHVCSMYVVSTIDYKQFNDPRLLENEYMAPRYFTGWNMVVQSIFLIVAILYDIHQWKDLFRHDVAKHIWQTRDFIFTALVGPSTLFVSGVFWSLYMINKEFMLPAYTDVICTPMINHSLHSVIMLVMMAEIMLQPKLRPKSDGLHYMTLIVYYVIYFGIFFHTYYVSGLWVYPFFKLLTPVQIFLTIGAMFISMFIFYEIQWFLSGLFWNTSYERLTKKIK